MMKIEKLVAPAVDWVGGSWALRMDQAASLLFCHGYITQAQREKITRTIEKQFKNALAKGEIVRRDTDGCPETTSSTKGDEVQGGGASADADRAVVNGAASVSALRASVPSAGFIPNVATEEGRELGKHLARFCDQEAAASGRDGRCDTCAFRAGSHVANGSVATLMGALKCALEREPFWCHEHDRPCAGWLLMRSDEPRVVPWDHVDGVDA